MAKVHTSFTQAEVLLMFKKNSGKSWSTDYTFLLKLKSMGSDMYLSKK